MHDPDRAVLRQVHDLGTAAQISCHLSVQQTRPSNDRCCVLLADPRWRVAAAPTRCTAHPLYKERP
jgi:hypothetical protein